MNWNKYFKERDNFKRYAMLERENRLSYDHVDNWLMSLKDFLSKTNCKICNNTGWMNDYSGKIRCSCKCHGG